MKKGSIRVNRKTGAASVAFGDAVCGACGCKEGLHGVAMFIGKKCLCDKCSGWVAVESKGAGR